MSITEMLTHLSFFLSMFLVVLFCVFIMMWFFADTEDETEG